MNETIQQGILVAVQGMAIVFIVLLILGLIVTLFRFFDRNLYKKKTNEKNQENEDDLITIPDEKIAAIALSLFLKNNKGISEDLRFPNETIDQINPWVMQGRQINLNSDSFVIKNLWGKLD
ncbi:MAG: hypothetical protein CL780_02195 [Chloroflexi bacterium]|nr:hypothetical protein [Chloroflexota bacterium]|tara:strand:+ start:2281 stop:2643 length:363 start_codon:yes stop_codon:yes gene_type:complete